MAIYQVRETKADFSLPTEIHIFVDQKGLR